MALFLFIFTYFVKIAC